MPTAVGVIVNPWAGKDVRRLHAPTGHTPDTAKVGIVRRVVIGALDAGARHVYVARDVGRIGERAVRGIDRAELVDGPSTGSALDTRRGARQLAELACAPIVVLGGDGTCRDVAIGAPGAAMIAVSTGTNNVFPRFVDGTSAGTAAGLVASGAVPLEKVAVVAKLLQVGVRGAAGERHDDVALVDVALVDDVRTGARAVVRPAAIRAVVAALATPTSTGLSSIAGRLQPLGPADDRAVVVTLAADDAGASRRVRVPIVPGSFDVLGVATLDTLDVSGTVTWRGPGVLAYDGERDRVLRDGDVVTVTVSRAGPLVVDVDRVLHCATARRLFDVVSAARQTDAGAAEPRADAHPSHPDETGAS